ncbi:maleylacetate reductase [Pseudonocardia sp.]|uniref:maleylacetate reductase n=1 Tax=Pseudonocardia sp. TaxID=60912 RepID=UPI003D119786
MQDFVHDVPAARVVFARGALARVPAEVERLAAQRIVLIAGGYEKRYADDIADRLGAAVVERLEQVVMHVPADVATEAASRARAADADLLLSVGGGSATGLAKAVALRTDLPILAVATTYAGSEMTPIWGVTDGARKTTGRDRRVLPRTVIYDPDLTLSLPAHLSAASGMNALAHLVEALYAPDASPITLLQAAEGVRALADALPRVVHDPSDPQARSDALYGAWLAGTVLGVATMGLHHKICHVLGGAFDLPHAPMHSAVLSSVTAFNLAAAPDAADRLRRALGTTDPARGVWDLARRIGAPTSLADVGFRVEFVDRAVAEIVSGRPINPRAVDEPAVRGILHRALAGDAPST